MNSLNRIIPPQYFSMKILRGYCFQYLNNNFKVNINITETFLNILIPKKRHK
ncbi:MAG: hypothetical protein HC817_13980 [Saprospiraceae bacterium]|nr:hypothetical protein [Saprospiraceae bacterium]